ncbi:hypothetical protein ACEQ8H_005693 [Pleosporales sp. CAS-2024a]
MHLLSLLAIGALTASAAGRILRKPNVDRPVAKRNVEQPVKRPASSIITTKASQKFAVNGAAGAIPSVSFALGESYAGLMPISDKPNDKSQMYFWFVPSANKDAGDEITIWLNGGPGCSSLEGFLQENGPISWQYGTAPYAQYNPWNWATLTNMVWVEYPLNTGFSKRGPETRAPTSQEEAAQQFLGFFKNFVDTFGLQNRKIYITGESYAGRYVPYIAKAMLNKKDTKYYGVKGIMIYDPKIAEDTLLDDVPAVPFVDRWAGLFNFNESFTRHLHDTADRCGYTKYMDKYLTYPPPGKLPTPHDPSTDGCDVWNQIYANAVNSNPCFDIYQIATTCPVLWDVLGFPGSFGYLPAGEQIYFNRTDVQRAINAPTQPWALCSDGVFNGDTSPESSWVVIPQLIDALDRTVIVHGELDFVLLHNGTLLAIQNMTWGGLQGFQKAPKDPFFVPYHNDVSFASLSAQGVMGTTHTERKLTWVSQALSGHMVPQYQPSSAHRQLEFLLGRIDSLSSQAPFTAFRGNAGPVGKRDMAAMPQEGNTWF